MKLHTLDYAIVALYFAFVLGVGFLRRRNIKSHEDFLSGKGLPLWITSLAFISANLGAQEVLGMAASGAKYGITTAHFYWVGAIPAMVFLGLFMMPFYFGSKARSVPEYLALRFDEKTRGFNALSFATMTVFSSGVSLYALALLLQSLLGWSFEISIALSAGIVLAYTLSGGLTGAIYNEVLQFFLITLGIFPLVWAGLERVGGWDGIVQAVPQVYTHAWTTLGAASQNKMGVTWMNMVLGLGFVLSFGYWCTDFLVIQRAMAAKSMQESQSTPLVAALPKLFMPFVVIFPGLIALALAARPDLLPGFSLPLKPDGRTDFDMTLPTLLTALYPNGLLGVGLTALLASFMAGMAGNVTAFNSVWTYDIYQSYINPKANDRTLLWMGKAATLFGILVSIATAYLARSFNNIMDLLQLVFGFVNAPLFATFLLGMFWKRATGHGAFWGLALGTLGAALTHGMTTAEGKGGWMGHTLYAFDSGMAQAFSIAIVAWSACFVGTILISFAQKPKSDASLKGLVFGLTPYPKSTQGPAWSRPVPIAILVLILTLFLNWRFR